MMGQPPAVLPTPVSTRFSGRSRWTLSTAKVRKSHLPEKQPVRDLPRKSPKFETGVAPPGRWPGY